MRPATGALALTTALLAAPASAWDPPRLDVRAAVEAAQRPQTR